MKDILQKQLKKEKMAASRIWRVLLKILIIYWAFLGASMLFSPLWPLGLVFCGAAVYVWFRITKNKIPKEE